MLARLSAFVIWALVAAAVVFWGLRLLVRAPAAPPYAVAVADAGAASGDLTRLLGSAAPAAAAPVAAAPEASSRFRLLGIAAPKTPAGAAASTAGVALIAVDGKMPKAYVVGSKIDGDLVLRSVSLRTASIAPPAGAPAIMLELPPLAPAATGTLPSTAPGMVETVPPQPMTPPAPVPQYAPAQSAQPPSMLPGMPRIGITPGGQPAQRSDTPAPGQ